MGKKRSSSRFSILSFALAALLPTVVSAAGGSPAATSHPPLVTTVSSSQEAESPEPQLIPNYTQLMELSPSRREDYLKRLQETISATQRRAQASGNEFFAEAIPESVPSLFWESFIASAYAQNASPENPTEAPSEAPSSQVSQAPLTPACVRPQPSCSSVQIRRLARRFRRGGPGAPCVYAGNISRLRPNGRYCEPVSDFCIGSPTCTREGNSDAPMTPDYTCRGNSNGNIICHPFLFGVNADQRTPFCIRPRQDATATCARLSAQTPNRIYPLERLVPGTSEAWNTYAEALNGMCGPESAGMAFHCSECQILRSRLIALQIDFWGGELCQQSGFQSSPARGSSTRSNSPPASTNSRRRTHSR